MKFSFVLSDLGVRVKPSYHTKPSGHVEESHVRIEEETECLTAVNLPVCANQFVYQINHLITICICLYGWHCQKRSSGLRALEGQSKHKSGLL